MVETEIKGALIRFNEAIKNSDGNALSDALSQVEALLAAHRDHLHPQLRHYLEGRSYAKATAWLGAGSEWNTPAGSPPGGCGGNRK